MSRDYAYSALYPLATSKCPSRSINIKQTYFIHVNIINTRKLDYIVQWTVDSLEKPPWPSSVMNSRAGLQFLCGPSYSHWQGAKGSWTQSLASSRSPLRDDFQQQKDMHFLFTAIWPRQKPERRPHLSIQCHPSWRLWGGGWTYGQPVG